MLSIEINCEPLQKESRMYNYPNKRYEISVSRMGSQKKDNPSGEFDRPGVDHEGDGQGAVLVEVRLWGAHCSAGEKGHRN